MASMLIWLLTSYLFYISSSEDTVSVEIDTDGTITQKTAEENTAPAPEPVEWRLAPGPPPQQFWVTFENDSEEEVELYYDDGRNGKLQGTMKAHETLRIGTYVGHQFYYRRPGQSRKMYHSTMESINLIYKFVNEETRDREARQLATDRAEFMRKYKNETGLRWLHTYPRPPPGLYFYPTEYIGQIHKISSKYSYYTCYPHTISEADIAKCRSTETINFEWKVVSIKPKVLELGGDRFLSDFEIEHIKAVATPLLHRSVTGAGGYENKARTSSNAWVKRSMSDVLDWIFHRLGDVVQVDESHLWDTIGSESVQVVHYDIGQEYKAHHDWRTNRLQTRFATFLMYLTDMASPNAGGETEFPRVKNENGETLKVHPGKGRAAMFYDMLEDGNVDDLTIHAALPVKEGEKWLANVWIWDPNFS
eukprot:11151_1